MLKLQNTIISIEDIDKMMMIANGFQSALAQTPKSEIMESKYIFYYINEIEKCVIYFEESGELVRVTKVVIEQ